MKKEQILGIVRHFLTFVGGIVIVKGYMDDTVVTEVTGAVMTLVGAVWSVFDKK